MIIYEDNYIIEYQLPNDIITMDKVIGVIISREGNPCDSCSNNPQNGGTGVCFCTLNIPTIA